MRRSIMTLSILAGSLAVMAQNYPNPDFNNEPYAYRKDSNRLVRLEKTTADIDNKSGFGGGSASYNVDGNRASVRFTDIGKFSFVVWDGSTGSGTVAGTRGDSMMRAAGVDPNMMVSMGMGGASQITLYKMETSGSRRTIIITKSGGFAFSKKSSSSEKFTTSTRKVRDGYIELVVDKLLPKGEYAFVIPLMGMGSARGGSTLFCFGVE